MFRKLLNIFKKPAPSVEIKQPVAREKPVYDEMPAKDVSDIIGRSIQKGPPQLKNGTMDSAGTFGRKQFMTQQGTIGVAQYEWFVSQGFIGFQNAALLAQHWLICKACITPAEDCIRNGYQITINNGVEVDAKVIDAMRQLDVDFHLNENLLAYTYFGRVFGIRIAKFNVESDDPLYYEKPFNIDGIKPGSYKGITQIDPYWITPMLDADAAANPESEFFYVPTWWMINARRIHRTHLCIFITDEVPDILKPTYVYGGIPIPQKIYDRVYAAERVANEAPSLALSKRTTIMKTDLAKALANQIELEHKMEMFSAMWNNYGIKIVDVDEEVEQFDTTLAEFDALIMTQYQLVSAASNIPATKLLGTSPKGFNATGEFDEKNYHEFLESLQKNKLTAFVDRHHALIIRSEIAPRFGIPPFDTSTTWNSLQVLDAKTQADINKTKADTGSVYIAAGVIDGEDERQRIINEPTSDYDGLDDEMPEIDNAEEDQDESET